MLNKQKFKKILWIIILKVGQAQKFEEANFARIQGTIADNKLK
jgi:hypothetical protein